MLIEVQSMLIGVGPMSYSGADAKIYSALSENTGLRFNKVDAFQLMQFGPLRVICIGPLVTEFYSGQDSSRVPKLLT